MSDVEAPRYFRQEATRRRPESLLADRTVTGGANKETKGSATFEGALEAGTETGDSFCVEKCSLRRNL